jgi:hypothetical protein
MRPHSKPLQARNRRRTDNIDASPYSRDVDIERQLAQVEAMNLTELRVAWLERFKKEPPKLKGRDFYVRVLCFRLQADRYGDHSPDVKRKLRDMAAQIAKDPKATLFPNPRPKAGIVLTRAFRGTVHQVLVQTEGYLYQGRVFATLSEVARHITGTNWSGPRFFGIHARVQRQIREAQQSA